MHTMHIAIIEMVLGALIIAASFLCPYLYAGVILGAMVLGFGIPLLVHPILPR